MPTTPPCPKCSSANTYFDGYQQVCADCAHEWAEADGTAEPAAEEVRVVRDANGNPLVDGDSVTLIKDLKVKGSSVTLKVGTKIRKIRIVDGDHEVDCKVDGVDYMLKASFLKKA